MRQPARNGHPHVRSGLAAIDALAAAWPRLPDAAGPRLAQTLAAMRFRIRDGGSGGALYRSLQARFEHDAASLLGIRSSSGARRSCATSSPTRGARSPGRSATRTPAARTRQPGRGSSASARSSTPRRGARGAVSARARDASAAIAESIENRGRAAGFASGRRLASMGMRDYRSAIRTHVVLFDGGMGATLEQFDLSLEDDYKLPGRAHEVLILNRPDVIEGVHASFLEAGADVVQTDTFQASRLKLDEWGLGDHTLEINRRGAEIARKAAGETRYVAGSVGPTGFLPASDDPTLGDISFRTLRRHVRRAVPRPHRGRRRPHPHRDRAGHPRGQGRDLRRARGDEDGRPRGPDPDAGLAAAKRRQDAARHRHLRRADDARGARTSTRSG